MFIVWACSCTWHGTHVAVRGPLVGFFFLSIMQISEPELGLPGLEASSLTHWVILPACKYMCSEKIFLKIKGLLGGWWWGMSLTPELRRQRQADCGIRGQPDLQSEFQDRLSYTEKPCLKKKMVVVSVMQCDQSPCSLASMISPPWQAVSPITIQRPCG